MFPFPTGQVPNDYPVNSNPLPTDQVLGVTDPSGSPAVEMFPVSGVFGNALAALFSETTVASSATPTPTGDKWRNTLNVTALAEAAELQAPTGAAIAGGMVQVRITDDGTSRALTYDAIYRDLRGELPTDTVIGKTLYIWAAWNDEETAWDIVGVLQES